MSENTFLQNLQASKLDLIDMHKVLSGIDSLEFIAYRLAEASSRFRDNLSSLHSEMVVVDFSDAPSVVDYLKVEHASATSVGLLVNLRLVYRQFCEVISEVGPMFFEGDIDD